MGAEEAPKDLSQYPPDIRGILERGTLRVALHKEDNWPYFMHNAEGRFTGWDVEMARDIAAELGVKIVFDRRARSYAEIVDIVAGGEVDMAAAELSRTLSRAKRVLYTKPYMTRKVGLLINRLQLEKLHPDKQMSLMQRLNTPKCKVAVRGATAHRQYAKELFPEAGVFTFPTWNPGAVEAVVKGEATVGITDETGIKEYILSKPEAALHVKTALVDYLNDYIAIALPMESRALRDWLDMYIEEKVPELTADMLLQRYSSDK